jgi:membrane-associated protein
MLHQALDLILHVNQHLEALVHSAGAWVYAILFAVVFAETGLVVTPFLPGDSLLFAAGALAGAGLLHPALTAAVLLAAAILGDAVNYAVGAFFRTRLAAGGTLRFIKPAHLQRTHAFFDRYGSRAIVIARFVPIVRTLAPFVAGVGEMHYRRFALFNILGALLWVAVCSGLGLAFGGLEVVKKNFSLVVLGIIAVSLLPVAIEALRHRAGLSGHQPNA